MISCIETGTPALSYLVRMFCMIVSIRESKSLSNLHNVASSGEVFCGASGFTARKARSLRLSTVCLSTTTSRRSECDPRPRLLSDINFFQIQQAKEDRKWRMYFSPTIIMNRYRSAYRTKGRGLEEDGNESVSDVKDDDRNRMRY